MEEKIIEFKLAKLAKEKGFSVGGYNEYVQYHEEYIYDEDPKHPESHVKDEIRFTDRFYHKNSEISCDYSNEFFTYYEAPTQGLLQKWFRETHKIDVVAIPIRFTGYLEIGYWTYSIKSVYPVGKQKYKFDTYEEALEVGLEEAFNLI